MFPIEKEISAAIVDDHPVVIEGLQKILVNNFNVSLLKEFNSGESLLAYLKESGHIFDIILLDITLPGKNGIDTCREVKLFSPDSTILAFSNHTERSIILQMIQYGASGYILKNTGAQELTECITAAMNGQIAFSRETREIISRPSMDELKKIPSLTKREKQILLLVADGKTSLEMAEELSVSHLTIETHRRNLMQKFEVNNVAMLIKMASKLQFI